MKRFIPYLTALSVLTLAGCQKNDIDNEQDSYDGIVKYAVTAGQSETSGSPATKAAKSAGQGDESNVMTLTDNTGHLSIPMECEVTDGIFCISMTAADTQYATKGTLINTDGSDKALSEFADAIGNKFQVKAYDGAAEKLAQTVKWSGSAWTGEPAAYWPQAKKLSFLAYANLPGSQTAAIASTGVSTTHTVPATAGEQKDILLGHYQGFGSNTGTAEIKFEHPLTAVQFKYGEIDNNLTVKSITLGGVAASGKATMTPNGTVSWSEVSTCNKTVSQSKDSGLPVDGSSKLIGEPFLLIPQTLSDNNVTVTITFTNGQVLSATIDAGQWKSGKTCTYTLNDTPLGIVIESPATAQLTSAKKAYLRAVVTGYWKDADENVTDSWDESQGSFTGLGGSKWSKGDDGNWYYSDAVSSKSAPEPLYTSYTAPSGHEGTLVMDVAFQAILFVSGKTCREAFEALP